MADIVFNIALGRVAYYASLPAANDALIAVPFASSGLGTDAALRDCATLTAVKALATEQTTIGRQTLASVTVTVDNTNDRVALDCADVVWTTPTGAAVGAVVICYVPDTTAQSDSTTIPLTKHGISWSPDGNTFTLGVADFIRTNSAA